MASGQFVFACGIVLAVQHALHVKVGKYISCHMSSQLKERSKPSAWRGWPQCVLPWIQFVLAGAASGAVAAGDRDGRACPAIAARMRWILERACSKKPWAPPPALPGRALPRPTSSQLPRLATGLVAVTNGH